jgi:hypothetical protein
MNNFAGDMEELQAAYDELCQRISPFDGAYSFLTAARHDGSPHVEIEGGVYHHIVTERGLELERETFDDKDDLLYRLVSDMAFWMAVEYEMKNRVQGQDARRIMFAKWIELMERVGADRAEKTRRHIGETLRENPYLDR